MDLWKLKLAARIHDPAEKALVLLRDPSGHEGGSIVGIGNKLGFNVRTVHRQYADGSVAEFERLNLEPEIAKIVEQADHWAAAADRPQFPKDTNERYPQWAQVQFASEGKLIHPLTGQVSDLREIGEDISVEQIKAVSEDLFVNLICPNPDSPDFKRTLLAFWRFGPELGRELQGIGHLWSLLPADTRVPDHSIWQHLDLTSALAGAMADGGRPALLTVSIGPVQEFIAASRSTSDLWAGSHFLSTLAWQAMKVIAEALGPDAILFPQLRGVPIVDLWLIENGIPSGLFDKYHAEWKDSNTDYNPLFGAALPNKFVAIVPEEQGKQLAEKITSAVREWALAEARLMLDMALQEINEAPAGQYCYRQLEDQLKDFPEVHWSLAPWLPAAELETTLSAFYPAGVGPEFFTNIWNKLKEPIEPEAGWKFWQPNDGVLYPAVHECGERLLAAAKSVRPFEQLEQRGYRDSLTGEFEWLTLDERQLEQGSPRERDDTLWARLSQKKPAWAKEGEHLSAFGLIKRLWPARYVSWLKDQGIKTDLNRYVISTHVMALAPSLENLIRNGPKDVEAFGKLAAQTKEFERAAMPRKLMAAEYRANEQWWEVATRLPTWLDDIREKAKDAEGEQQVEKIRRCIEKAIGVRVETYYALILMDGDRLGAWLSGECGICFGDSFHDGVRKGLMGYNDSRLRDYLNLRRPASPAGHMAISAALNGFSLDLVRHVVEDLCLGKLLYSGGDDVMAMVCVRDLPMALWLLRLVYSGGMPGQAGENLFDHDLDLKRGFVQWKNRLYRVMGERATASAGAVIAHHMAPLGAVLRNLHDAEKCAKQKGGRNAFSIRVLKRSGSAVELTLPWWLPNATPPDPAKPSLSPMHALETLRKAIAGDLSRRVAYHVEEWIRGFPLLERDDELQALIARNLEYQFKRKSERKDSKDAKISPEQANNIASIAVQEARRRLEGTNDARGKLACEAYDVLRGILFTAEFLAREARGGEEAKSEERLVEAHHG
ncbi:MAG TPA: type III-B CRISPR-associated protein Cas10/Cmr2 [Terriglobia bacterium]|nr:type III-B CRISPR-associated protein Cas10/Cmr2 [Terriglobia bacterium]